MDPSTSGLDVTQCDLCGNAVVQMHCDTCLVKLCKACVGEHLSTGHSKPHKIIDLKDRASNLIFPGCTTHCDSPCESFCRDCKIPVCLLCVFSGNTHKDHQLSLIADMFSSMKLVIQKDQRELEEIIIPTHRNITSYMQIRMSQLEKEYGYVSDSVTKHGKKWHREINKLVDKMKAEVEEMKAAHLEALTKHQEEFSQRTMKLQVTLQACKNTLASNDTSLVLNHTLLNEEYRRLPQKLTASFPAFKAQKISAENLTELFGMLTKLSFTSDEQGYFMKKAEKSPEAVPLPPVRSLLDEPEIVTIIDTGYKYLYDVQVCQSNEEIWSKGKDSRLKLFKIHPVSLLRSVRTESGNTPEGIALTYDGDLVYSDYDERTVNIVKNEQIEEVIRLESWRPVSICHTSSGDLLVTMDSDDNKHTKLVRYSDFAEKQTIQFDDESKPLYSPGFYLHISENRNLDICAADGSGAVVVVNSAGKLRFRYTGHAPAPKNESFYPVGIATNSQGHILISDYDNHCIHITDEDGHFLRFIDCGLSYPWGLSTDSNDNLFVADSKKKSGKIIKYRYFQ